MAAGGDVSEPIRIGDYVLTSEGPGRIDGEDGDVWLVYYLGSAGWRFPKDGRPRWDGRRIVREITEDEAKARGFEP